MPGASVLAVLVAHASRTRVAEALRSLSEQTYRDIEVVVGAIGEITVPDDTSPSIVHVPDGAGFAAAVNAVLDRWPLDGYTYVLLLHDDVSLEPDAVERLVATAGTDPAIAAVGAKLVEWSQPDVLQEVGSTIDRFAIRRSALDAGEIDAGQRDDESDVLFCSDACLLIRRDALVEVGALDAKAFPFYEDVDLCWRLRARGARVVVATDARVRHAADLSRGRRLFAPLALKEHAEHGRLRFMLKHYALLGLVVLLPQLAIADIARLIVAVVRRELWRVRVIVGAWARTFTELPNILSERRKNRSKAIVDDRELLSLGARGAAGDARAERSEWLSQIVESVGRATQRGVEVARQPVTWAMALAIVVVIALSRGVLFGKVFALGEIRDLAPFGDALADHFGRVAREGLDPFGLAGPGAVILGLLRSIVLRAAFAEKVALLLPVWLAGVAGARWARSLGFPATGRRWLATVAAVNPVTLQFLRDGSLGALVAWAASLWFASEILAPSPPGEGSQARVRFVARWAFGWAVTVALHPPAFLWLVALGGVIVVARLDDGRTVNRLRIIGAGALGSFVLLLPWSATWLWTRSPLVGRPGWLVNATGGGLARAALGGGWPFIAWLALAVAAAFFVGLDRTAFSLSLLAGGCVLAGVTGAFPRETMLAGAGVTAFLIVSIVARHIVDELPRYEFGVRQTAVVAGIVAAAVLWAGGVAGTVPGGLRTKAIPDIEGVGGSETGRVLWLAETTGGLRAWSTLSFSERIGAFPPPAGPEERMVTRAVEAARAGRTHRLGGVLALADISHIVSLDEGSRKGLESQADIGPTEEQGRAVVYRNDAWRGPAILLAGPPADPLSPAGLATVVRDPRQIPAAGWPYGPVHLQVSRGGASKTSVVYVAGGHRGGLRLGGASGHIAAAGSYVPASRLTGTVDVTIPGRWWRWMFIVEAILLIGALGAWLTAAYLGAPLAAPDQTPPELNPIAMSPLVAVVVPLVIALALGVGWSGVTWGTSSPFLSAAWYCPPVGPGAGSAFTQNVGVVNPNSTLVGYVVRDALTLRPFAAQRISAGARQTLTVDASKGAVIESYGRRVVAATEVSRSGNKDTALCTPFARTLNVFPEGGRAATRAIPRLFERYVVYNPFPDLARASVKFISTGESIVPPPLQDIHVPPGKAVVVDPETQFEPKLDLSTVIKVWQGRAIVSRRLVTVDQLTWSLPVDPGRSGYVPRATTRDAVTNIIAVNLNEDPAHIKASGNGKQGSFDEQTLDVNDSRRNDLELARILSNADDLLVHITSDRDVAIESLVAPDDRKTVSVLPLVEPEKQWVVPFAEGRDLVISNPSSRKVHVVFDRLGPGAKIHAVDVGPNRVVHVKPPGKKGFGVAVSATGPGVIVAAIGAAGSTIGVPVD